MSIYSEGHFREISAFPSRLHSAQDAEHARHTRPADPNALAQIEIVKVIYFAELCGKFWHEVR